MKIEQVLGEKTTTPVKTQTQVTRKRLHPVKCRIRAEHSYFPAEQRSLKETPVTGGPTMNSIRKEEHSNFSSELQSLKNKNKKTPVTGGPAMALGRTSTDTCRQAQPL